VVAILGSVFQQSAPVTAMLAEMVAAEVACTEISGGMVPFDMTVNLGYNLTEITVHVEAAELRQCGHCHRQLVVMEYDRNARGQLLRTCRICLVTAIFLIPILY